MKIKRSITLLLVFAMIGALFSFKPLTCYAAERETLKFTQVSAAGHTLAIRDDGTVFAWGDNRDGQIGDGTKGDATSKMSPIKINGFGGKKIKAVYATSGVSCALAEDGTVWSWGNGENCGVGVSTSVLVPTQITGLSGKNIVEIKGCMALDDTGTVWTWGKNSEARLGTGSNTPDKSLTPVQATVLSGKIIKAIRSDGMGLRAAIASDGTAWAWGVNSSKVLTNTANLFEANPIQITLPGGRTIKDIEIGGFPSMYVLATDGTVWSKGGNSEGQLGIGNTTAQTSFVQIPSLSDVTEIAASATSSYYFAMALKTEEMCRLTIIFPALRRKDLLSATSTEQIITQKLTPHSRIIKICHLKR